MDAWIKGSILGYWGTGIQRYNYIGIQRYRDPWIHIYKHNINRDRIWEYMDAGIKGYMDLGIQGYMDTWIWRFREYRDIL